MKLNIADKIIIGIVGILLIFAGISIKNRSYSGSGFPQIVTDAPSSKVKQLPENIIELADKYGVYKELYASDKPTLVYGYNKFYRDESMNKIFHKKLTEKISENKIKFNIFVVENYKDKSSEIIAKSRGETGSCSPKENEELDALINTSQNCLEQACIIDMKNQKYTIINRDINDIIETLKEYKSGAN